jgi:uncharacterized protein (TIGR03067 family)
MFRVICVGLLITAPALAESRDEYERRKLMESLQGNWAVSNMAVAGMPVSPGAIQGMGYRFDEDRLVQSNKPEESARLNIDVSGRVPKVEYVDRHGMSMVGIIQRMGDKVYMCMVEAGQEPPTRFSSNTDNRAILIELSRPRR